MYATPALTFRRCLSVFVFIGPAIGFLVTLTQWAISSGAGPEVLAGPLLGAMVFPLVYALGFVPMLLGGVAYWVLRRFRLVLVVPMGASALVGGVLGGLPVWLLFSFFPAGAGNAVPTWTYCIPGAITAAICAVICERRNVRASSVVPSA
jgi:hypothetical protein